MSAVADSAGQRSFVLLRQSCVFQLHIAAVQVVVVTALVCRDQVHVFQTMDIVGRQKTVADAGGVAVHPALVITTEQTIHIEFREIASSVGYGHS